jgi:hypothetical protein
LLEKHLHLGIRPYQIRNKNRFLFVSFDEEFIAMRDIQTLTLNRKKFAVLPYAEYKKMLAQIEDLRDLADIKLRAKEHRISLAEVKGKYIKSHK